MAWIYFDECSAAYLVDNAAYMHTDYQLSVHMDAQVLHKERHQVKTDKPDMALLSCLQCDIAIAGSFLCYHLCLLGCQRFQPKRSVVGDFHSPLY